MNDLALAIKKIQEIAQQRRIYRYKPYPWQAEFHNAGDDNPERMLMAANRVGKTESAAAEIAIHMTGDYPDWWEGKRFNSPVLIWLGSVTNEASRDIVQKALLGGSGEDLGTGFIPKGRIVGKPSMRQAGISDVVDTVKARHASGGVSTGVFKTYDQGWRKWQGAAPHVVWLDEEPDGNESGYRIFTEAQTRILTSKGILMVTFTPLQGETELVRHFTDPQASGIYLKTATWADAPHLDPVEIERLGAAYPDYELEARSKGIPMLGSGRVFPVSEEDIKCDPFKIPPHYAQIKGIDFGIDHPAAGASLAWDRDRDIIYVYDCYRKKDETPVYHAAQINKANPWIPVSWPHDGLQRGKADGKQLKDQYAVHGVNLLSLSARYSNDKGGAQPEEPVIMEILERCQTGGFKVFSNLGEFFEEFRGYHRKDGKIVARRDDVLKAVFYGVMMKRYARQEVIPTVKRHMRSVLK